MDTLPRPFPLQVVHQVDEPAHALLLRTLVRNGSSDFAPIFKRYGVGSGNTIRRLDIDRVAHVCGADPERLRHASAAHVGRGYVVMGHAVRHEYFSDWNRRWCPYCLEESPHHRVWWDITGITTCPIHGVELATGCGCKDRLRHGIHSITQCRLGHDLRGVPVSSVPEEELVADRYFLDRLFDEGKHPQPVLDLSDIGTGMQILERIGISVLDEMSPLEEARRKFGIRKLISTGYATLADYPQSFDAYMDTLLERREEKDFTSVLRSYGPIREWLGNQRIVGKNCGIAEELKSAFDRHAERNTVVLTRMLHDGKPVVGAYASKVARELHLHPASFVRLVRLLKIPMEENHPAGIIIAPDLVEIVMDRYRRLETMEHVVDVLGVRRQVVVELANHGHLPYLCRPYKRPEKPEGKRGGKRLRRLRDAKWNTWYFEPGVADAFVQKLRGLVRIDPGIQGDDLVEMLHATTMFASTEKVVRMVLDGSLPVRGVDTGQPGLRGVLISLTEARVILKLERREGYPLRMAAGKMGLSYCQLLSCVKAGLIEPAGSGTRLSLSDDVMEDFRHRFMTAKEVADAFGVTSAKLAIRHMREHGVDPVPNPDGVLKLFMFPREDAERIVKTTAPPVAFQSSRERMKHEKKLGLPLAATRGRTGYRRPARAAGQQQ